MRVSLEHVVTNRGMHVRVVAGDLHDDGGDNQREFPMLTEPVHVVDNQQGIIRSIISVVGLEFSDEIDCPRLSHSTYFFQNFQFCLS